LKKGMRLDPLRRSSLQLGTAYREAGQYEKALTEYEKCIKHKPKNIIAHQCLAITYALAGRYEEAREAWAEVLGLDPKASVEKLFKICPYRPERCEQVIAALKKAELN
jgi:adenylate cyclase